MTNGFPTEAPSQRSATRGAPAGGSLFTFAFDYGDVPSELQFDTIGIAIATAMPEPRASVWLAVAAACLALRKMLRARGQ